MPTEAGLAVGFKGFETWQVIVLVLRPYHGLEILPGLFLGCERGVG